MAADVLVHDVVLGMIAVTFQTERQQVQYHRQQLTSHIVVYVNITAATAARVVNETYGAETGTSETRPRRSILRLQPWYVHYHHQQFQSSTLYDVCLSVVAVWYGAGLATAVAVYQCVGAWCCDVCVE